MKKIVLFVLVTFCIVFCFTSCKNILKDYPWELKESAVSICEDDEWSIRIDENTVTSSGITYYVCNNTDKESGCGVECYLQVKLDGKWYDIVLKENYEIPSVERILEVGKEVEFTCYTEDVYGKLPKGDYRIVKPLRDINLACEFKVK